MQHELHTKHEEYLRALNNKKKSAISEYDANLSDVHLWQHQIINEINEMNTTIISKLSNFRTCMPSGRYFNL